MNFIALVATVVFSLVFLAIFLTLYYNASRSRSRGEIGMDGIVLLRWALLGFVVIYSLIALTAILQ